MNNPFLINKNHGGSTANEIIAIADKNVAIADSLCEQAKQSATNGDFKTAGDFCLTAADRYFASFHLYEQASRTAHMDRQQYIDLSKGAFDASVGATEQAKAYYDAIASAKNPTVATIPDRYDSTFKKSSGFGAGDLLFPILGGEDVVAKATSEAQGDAFADNKDFESAINAYLAQAVKHDQAIPGAKAKGDTDAVAHHVNEAQRLRSKVKDLKSKKLAEGDIANEINKSVTSGFSSDALLYPLTKETPVGHAFRGNQYSKVDSDNARQISERASDAWSKIGTSSPLEMARQHVSLANMHNAEAERLRAEGGKQDLIDAHVKAMKAHVSAYKKWDAVAKQPANSGESNDATSSAWNASQKASTLSGSALSVIPEINGAGSGTIE
jgi:regulator of sigma D